MCIYIVVNQCSHKKNKLQTISIMLTIALSTVTDIDECAEYNGGCEITCNNFEGSFSCGGEVNEGDGKLFKYLVPRPF